MSVLHYPVHNIRVVDRDDEMFACEATAFRFCFEQVQDRESLHLPNREVRVLVVQSEVLLFRQVQAAAKFSKVVLGICLSL